MCWTKRLKVLTILDTTPPSHQIKDDIPLKRYAKLVLELELHYRLSINTQALDVTASIFSWKTIIPDGIPSDIDT